MAFYPTSDRVLVRRSEPETRTSSGFIIPDAIVGKSNRGTVVATGPGRTTKTGVVIPVTVEVGDTIQFEDGGIPVTVDGESLLVLTEDQIYAVVK